MIYTIATAGHIDHGKSSLVKALTGINPDRLPEEQAREMTIELGFAWFTLDNSSEVGIVDVPGHERFIRNMISGMGGIDYVLFLVAADDGWMPQSQEHLEILNFLGHIRGAIVLSKIDLVKDDWLDLVMADVKSKIRGTFLEAAPILEFSAHNLAGLDEIKAHLNSVLPTLPARPNPRRPRLYIDRVFSMTGIGTIVTGTMRDGSFRIGDEVSLVPSGKTLRIKSIQTFKQLRERSHPGARTAISLTGIEKTEISRGDCLIAPEQWEGSRQLALRVRISPLNRIPLSHNRKITLLIGTSEVEARIRLFRDEDFKNQTEGVLMLELDRKIMARLGDRVILRYPTPDVLVGGGVVSDVDLENFIRRDKDLRKFYYERKTNDLREMIFSELRKYKTREGKKLLEASNFSREDIERVVDDLIKSREIERYGNFLITSEYKTALFGKISAFLDSYHRDYPSRQGVSRGEIGSKLKLDQVVVDFALKQLQAEARISLDDNAVFLSGHQTSLKPGQEKIRQDIMTLLAVPDLLTPTRREVEKRTHQVREVLNYLIRSGQVVELPEGILYRAEDFIKISETIMNHLKKHGGIEVKDIKNALGLTRKYTIPILEYLDKQGITRRDGDRRILNG